MSVDRLTEAALRPEYGPGCGGRSVAALDEGQSRGGFRACAATCRRIRSIAMADWAARVGRGLRAKTKRGRGSSVRLAHPRHGQQRHGPAAALSLHLDGFLAWPKIHHDDETEVVIRPGGHAQHTDHRQNHERSGVTTLTGSQKRGEDLKLRPEAEQGRNTAQAQQADRQRPRAAALDGLAPEAKPARSSTVSTTWPLTRRAPNTPKVPRVIRA